MAIFGIGATYDGKDNVLPKFIRKSVACIGYDETEAQPLHSILKHLKVGDIVYVKSHPPSIGLIVRAIGIVTSEDLKPVKNLGTGIPVKWLWEGEARLGKFDDKYPVRNITVYEEYSQEIQTQILNLLFSRFSTS